MIKKSVYHTALSKTNLTLVGVGADEVGLPPSHCTAGSLQEGSPRPLPGTLGWNRGMCRTSPWLAGRGGAVGPEPVRSKFLPNVRVGIQVLNGSQLEVLTPGWSLQGFQILCWRPDSLRAPEEDLEEYQAACLGRGCTGIQGHRRLDTDFCPKSLSSTLNTHR